MWQAMVQAESSLALALEDAGRTTGEAVSSRAQARRRPVSQPAPEDANERPHFISHEKFHTVVAVDRARPNSGRPKASGEVKPSGLNRRLASKSALYRSSFELSDADTAAAEVSDRSEALDTDRSLFGTLTEERSQCTTPSSSGLDSYIGPATPRLVHEAQARATSHGHNRPQLLQDGNQLAASSSHRRPCAITSALTRGNAGAAAGCVHDANTKAFRAESHRLDCQRSIHQWAKRADDPADASEARWSSLAVSDDVDTARPAGATASSPPGGHDQVSSVPHTASPSMAGTRPVGGASAGTSPLLPSLRDSPASETSLRTDRSCRSVGTASATGEVIAAGGARYSLQQRWTTSQAAAGSRASARSKQEMTAKTWWLQMVSREKFARSAMMGVAKSED